MAIPPVVIAAGVSGVASLLGGNKQSKSSKSAAEIQAQLTREALAEQKRIYEIEDKKERERYEYDKQKTLADEARVRGSRQNAFGGFGADLAQFSQGYAPAYGMSAEQTQGIMDQRNGGGGGYVAPQMGDKGLGPSEPMSPGMPGITQGSWSGPGMKGPSSMSSTVWLKAPTGETMEVPMEQAGLMLQAGAVLIPPPPQRGM